MYKRQILIDAFLQLASEPMEDTQIYLQNVYATLFSFKNDSRMNLSMLKTALVNTKKLNKALQDMLHNMDKFFERLLEDVYKRQMYLLHLRFSQVVFSHDSALFFHDLTDRESLQYMVTVKTGYRCV